MLFSDTDLDDLKSALNAAIADHEDHARAHVKAKAAGWPWSDDVARERAARADRQRHLLARLSEHAPSVRIQRGLDVITALAKADIDCDEPRFKKDRAAIDAALVWLGALRLG